MVSELLNILEMATAASTCGMLLTLLLRIQLRTFFGPLIAYFLWLLVPTSLIVLLLPAPSAGLKAALPVPLSMPSLTGHVASVSMSSGVDWTVWLLVAWGIGALLCCSRLVRQQRRFIASLGLPIDRSGEVLRAAFSTGSPVVMGMMRPKIVVPSDFETRYAPEEQALILAHERTHVRRGDLIMNALWAFARCLFWFNPLIHIAARLSRFDQELACDASVMRAYPNSRKPYATAMLRTQLMDSALPLGCYWPSTHPLKERIMLLKQPPARGLRRVIGQLLVGTCVCLVGYGTWAVQPDTAAARDRGRVNFADSEIRISSDRVQQSGDSVRYTGNVIVEIVGHEVPIRFNSHKASFGNGAVAEGDVRIDRKLSAGCCSTVTSIDAATMNVPSHRTARGPAVLEGNVQIEVDGRIFKTERAVMSLRGFRMDTVEVLPKGSSEATAAR
jgi:beta-lactamase regulating signal transducer with metallopeptidase domain